jgi:hypothetical protein
MNHFNPKLYWIETPAAGRLAISARPRGGDWLEDEIEGWREQGVDVVVSLLTASENAELELKDEGQFSKARGLRFFSFPIEDRNVPKSAAKLQEFAAQINSEIQQGKKGSCALPAGNWPFVVAFSCRARGCRRRPR